MRQKRNFGGKSMVYAKPDNARSQSGGHTQKKDFRQKLGRTGEAESVAWLLGKGFRILARNWRCRTGELDIVAMCGNVLSFIEVKSRRGLRFGRPAEAVTPRKAAHIRHSAALFLMKEKGRLPINPQTHFRFDVIELIYSKGNTEIHYIEDAFQ
jgi:putative endonuclease